MVRDRAGGHRRAAQLPARRPRALPRCPRALSLALAAARARGAARRPPRRRCSRIGLPGLPFHLRLDALSAFFLVRAGRRERRASRSSPRGYFREGEGTPPGLMCLEYHVFLASMALVLLADDAYAFMVSWETMALSSFFLVTTNHRIPEIRRAGYLYLLIAHIGAIAILLCFGVLQANTGDYTFANMRAQHLSPFWASAAFLLALFGFGAKAGILPLHVWLPEAHPAAPSPVSALMSGVMLKTAIYGMLRVSFDLLHTPLWWWGVVAARAGAGHRAVRRRVRGGADRHEAAARLLVDREHRPHRSSAWGSRSSSRAYGMHAAGGAGADRDALPLRQPRDVQEPALPRHRLGAARHRRAQPRQAGRPDPLHALGGVAVARRRASPARACRRSTASSPSGCCCRASCSPPGLPEPVPEHAGPGRRRGASRWWRRWRATRWSSSSA